MIDAPVWFYVAAGAVLVAVGIVARQLGATFNIHNWIQARAERRARQDVQLCTHTDIVRLPDGSVRVTSRMRERQGASGWVCAECGYRTPEWAYPKRIMDYWGRRPAEWQKREQRRARIAQTLGR